MQRKDLDETAFDDLRSGIVSPVESEGVITVVSGQHPLYGAIILVAAAGAYAVLGNDVHLIVGRDETVETDLPQAVI